MRLACDLLLQYSEETILDTVKLAFQNIGFNPNYYNIFYNQFKKGENDLVYDEKEVLKLFSKKSIPEVIKINSSLYDDEGIDQNYWFRISLNVESDGEFRETIGNTFLLEWSNASLNFLLESDFFKTLISSDDLVFCYLYNQDDVGEQSNIHYNQYSDEPKEKSKKVIKNEYGDLIVDVSKNWGRIERIRSVCFVAASNMRFGLGFSPVCNLELLSVFRYAKREENIVNIKLFDLDENPENYRDRQKEYWDYLRSNEVLKKYEKNNEFDFTEWLKKKAKTSK